ncbi:MAG TPA: serine/threonine-protein kinase, partial [Yinghuangia sp.]|nr:serine/threonine-protein kinase [Yinghuangia sp.]
MAERLEPGDPEVVGPFRLIARLGAGGMGQVFLGVSGAGRQVAVKLIHPDIARRPGYRERFRREVALAEKAGGFWTAPVVDADPDAETPWVASQYVPGVPLEDHITAHGAMHGPSLWRLGAGLAEALVSFHRVGLVHRDLKPSNIILVEDGPRVIDFGISKALEEEDGTPLTATGAVVGTPGFMSPEQALGDKVGPPTDIFSLGAVLVFAATGHRPFGGGSVHALLFRVVSQEPELTGVPEDLLPLVRQCLAKQPADRPTAVSLATVFAQGGEAVQAAGGADVPTAALGIGQPAAPPLDVSQRAHPRADPGPDAETRRVAAAATTSETQGVPPPPPTRALPSEPTAAAVSVRGTAPAPPPNPPSVAPAPIGHEFAVEDGGGAVFRRRLRRPALWSLFFITAFWVLLAVLGEPVAGLFVGCFCSAFGFVPRLIGALPLLVRGSLDLGRQGIMMRLGDSTLSVPWRDVSHVSYKRDGLSLRLAVTLAADSAVSVPGPLRRPGTKDPHEAEYLLLSWSEDEAHERAA